MKTVSPIVEQIEESTRTRKVVCTEVIEFRDSVEIAHLQNCNAVQKYEGNANGSFMPVEKDYVQRVRRIPAGLTAKERMLLFQVSTLYQKHANNPEGDRGRLVEISA